MSEKCGCGKDLCYDRLFYDFEDKNDTGRTKYVKIVYEWCIECGYEHLYSI